MSRSSPEFVLLLLASFTVLPLLPAFLLFKLLPSTARADGPFKGLKVNLGGAFAGYVVVLLALIGVAWSYLKSPEYQTWSISGSIAFVPPAPTPNVNDVTCYVRPPDLHLQRDGTFEFTLPLKVADSGAPELPKLVFDLKGWTPAVVHLVPSGGHPAYGAKELKQTIGTASRTIRIDEPVELYRLADQPAY